MRARKVKAPKATKVTTCGWPTAPWAKAKRPVVTRAARAARRRSARAGSPAQARSGPVGRRIPGPSAPAGGSGLQRAQTAQLEAAAGQHVGADPEDGGDPGGEGPLEEGGGGGQPRREAEQDESADGGGLVRPRPARDQADGPAHVGDGEHEGRLPPGDGV